METKIKILFLSPIIIFALISFFVLSPAQVWAVATPTLSLASSANSSLAQLTVYGEPNSSVELHYGNGASAVNTMGQTDQNGSFSTPISASAYNLSCGSTAYVIVAGLQSVSIPWSLANGTCNGLPLTQSNFDISVGQATSTIITNNTPSLLLSSNSNSSVASASVNGNQISITGLNNGTTNIVVCATSVANLCGTVSVSVGSGSSVISFDKNNVNLTLNQIQTVAIYGSGSYYISNNTVPGNVSAGLNGSTLSLFGAAAGGSTITVCQSVGGCGTVYASVVGTSQNNSAVSTDRPALASFSVMTNKPAGRFAGVGDFLTINFTTNVPVLNPVVIIGSNKLTATGSGIGPYVATYTLTGREASPLALTFGLTNLAGQSDNFYLFFSGANSNSSAVVNVKSEAPANSSALIETKKIVLSSFLSLGSEGQEVKELQKILTDKGFYNGPITSYFGPLTEKAVKALQKANGIKQAGYVGPSTRAILNK